MGRKSKRQLAEEAAAAAGAAAGAAMQVASASATENEEEGVPATSADAQIADALSEASADETRQPVAKIFRIDPETKKKLFFDEVGASLPTDSWMLRTYGGGTFIVEWWGLTTKYPNRRWGYLKSKQFEFDLSVPFKGPRKDPHALPSRVYNPDGSDAGGKSSMDEMREMALLGLFKQIQDQSALTAKMASDHSTAVLTLMQQAVGGNKGSGTTELITVLTPLIAPLLSGLVGRKDPLELAGSLMALMKGNGVAPQDPMEQIKRVIETMHLLKGEVGDGDKGETWETMGPRLLAGGLEILKGEAAKAVPPAPRPASRPTDGSVPAPMRRDPGGSTLAAISGDVHSNIPLATAGDPREAAAMSEARAVDGWTPYEPWIARLAQFAAAGKDPYGVMNMVLVMASPQMLGMIRELVARDDAATVLCERFPVLQPYQAWTADLVEYFYTEFNPDHPARNAPGGEDTADAE